MVRTRDFVLLLLTIFFLLLAIMGTELWHSWRSIPILSTFWSDETAEVDYVGEVPQEPDQRAGRLEVLRAKIAERLTQGTESAEVVEHNPVATSSETEIVTATTTDTAVVVKTCGSYHVSQVSWSPQSIHQENREGVRVYYEQGPFDPVASSTSEVMRAVIPLRSWPLGNSSCLLSDVIGIAMDGSLIRNNELALYTVFGPDTLVGYSLDGFPIYGPSGVTTDTCGGATVGGVYRYVLDANRAGLITCFAGVPTRID